MKKLLYLFTIFILTAMLLSINVFAATPKVTVKTGKTITRTITVKNKLSFRVKHGKKKIATKKIKYTSSNKSIATINKSGIITAKNRGSVVLTGKYKKKKAKVRVNVTTPNHRGSISITNKNDKSFTLKAKSLYAYYGVKNVQYAVWCSTNGQNDIAYYTVSPNSSKTVKITSHMNEYGVYNIYLYVIDNKGLKQKVSSTTIKMNKPSSTTPSGGETPNGNSGGNETPSEEEEIQVTGLNLTYSPQNPDYDDEITITASYIPSNAIPVELEWTDYKNWNNFSIVYLNEMKTKVKITRKPDSYGTLSIGAMPKGGYNGYTRYKFIAFKFDAPESAKWSCPGTFGSETTAIYNMFNSERTNTKNHWYWNEDNKTKGYWTNVQPLERDVTLEKIAMIRAKEIAEAHKNLHITGHVYADGIKTPAKPTMLESISYNGYGKSASAFKYVMSRLAEEDENYEGQGHRRHIYNSSENGQKVGIGWCNYKSQCFWVIITCNEEYCDPYLFSMRSSVTNVNSMSDTHRRYYRNLRWDNENYQKILWYDENGDFVEGGWYDE